MAKPRTINTSIRRPGRVRPRGLALGLVVMSLGILTTLAVGLLSVAYGARRQSIAVKADTAAMMAAEAGYERAVFWMSQQKDMLSALDEAETGSSGTVTFPEGSCTYQVSLYMFIGARPIFRVLANGYSGVCRRTVDVLVVQAVSGWDIGVCQIPYSATETTAVHFASGETLDMPIGINKANDSPDTRDIHISGRPSFLAAVAMGESRYTGAGQDKYYGVMNLFDGGIHFNQPLTRITNENSVQKKVDRFLVETKTQYRFTPICTADLPGRQPAVQLEFFTENGHGKVRITNNCTVRGFQQPYDSRTYDFRIQPGSDGQRFERYDIYTYHVAPDDADSTGQRMTVSVEDTYVVPSYDGVTSEPGGQIYVDGNVVIGGNSSHYGNDQMVKGRVTVVATGNIWVADSIHLAGEHDTDGMPTLANENILGLMAQGVIKVVDPGLSTIDRKTSGTGYVYVPVGRPDDPQAREGSRTYNDRHLSDPVIVEAAITVGGGGWGAENVQRGSYGGRKEADGNQDFLEVHGSICEAIRGVVGIIGSDGFLKSYRMDQRLLTGIVPGDIWLRGKYIPAPAGWHDYRPEN